MGFYGTLTGIVYVAAPLIGGVIGDLLGWRLTFYISVPMTVIVLLILLFRMENIRPSGPQADLDWIGTGLLCGATIGIVMMFLGADRNIRGFPRQYCLWLLCSLYVLYVLSTIFKKQQILFFQSAYLRTVNSSLSS